MWLYPETQAIWKSLKLVLSLFNDTFRQNPNKPFEIDSGLQFIVMFYFSFEETKCQC